jgi:Transposase
MARGKKHSPEQIVSLLRQIEVAVGNGKTMAQASKEALITEQTYYRWRKEFGGLQADQSRRPSLAFSAQRANSEDLLHGRDECRGHGVIKLDRS